MALLVSLAALAELAAARSLPVRWFVLFILRRADALAGAFVSEAAGAPPAVEGLAAARNAPEDALRLAARFKALAAALRALLPAACRLDRRPAGRGLAFRPIAPGSGPLRGWTRRPNDTS